jgi:hypothetical protein
MLGILLVSILAIVVSLEVTIAIYATMFIRKINELENINL